MKWKDFLVTGFLRDSKTGEITHLRVHRNLAGIPYMYYYLKTRHEIINDIKTGKSSYKIAINGGQFWTEGPELIVVDDKYFNIVFPEDNLGAIPELKSTDEVYHPIIKYKK